MTRRSRFIIGLLLFLSMFVNYGFNSAYGVFTTAYYEGENFTGQSGCAASTANFPYIGTGYLDMGNNGSYAEWNNIYVSSAGKYTLIFKYANGSGANRQCELKVNGTVIKNMPFPTIYSGDWTQYWNARAVVDLNSGNNTIRLTVNTANGGPNIDNIGVSSNGLSSPPAPVFDVKNYGAKGDGLTNDRVAIQNAINACTPGGSVVLDSGIFLSGQLILKSDMTLWISETATLKAVQDTSQYPDTLPNSTNVNIWRAGTGPGGGHELKTSFIYANKVNNLTITGGGKVDGNDNYTTWNNANENGRPVPVYITQSTNVTLTNFDIQNGAMWDCVPLECDGVTIDGININSPNPRNRDGIDICDSHDVTISNCTITSGDDAICPKTGSAKGIDNLHVKNVAINYSYASGTKLGTLSYGSFTNSIFEDITVKSARVIVGIESVDGADVNNITYSRLKGDGTGTCLFIIHGAGIRNHKPTDAPVKYGSIRGITIQDVDCRNVSSQDGSSILGTIRDGVTYWVDGVTLKNITVTSFKGGATSVPGDPPEYSGQYPEYSMYGMLPAWGYYIRHASNVTITNCSQTVYPSDVRQAIVKVDVTSGSMPTPTPPPTPTLTSTPTPAAGTDYQAESYSAISGCSVATDNSGYTGAGYVDYGGTGTYAEWNNINCNINGTKTITFTYANGGSTDRPCAITVNGNPAGNVSFSTTGSWTTWVTATINVTMNSGNNTLRITANSSGPNIDKFNVKIQ